MISLPYFADWDWQCLPPSGKSHPELDTQSEWDKKQVINNLLSINPDYHETHLHKLFLGNPAQVIKEAKNRWLSQDDKESVPKEAKEAIKKTSI